MPARINDNHGMQESRNLLSACDLTLLLGRLVTRAGYYPGAAGQIGDARYFPLFANHNSGTNLSSPGRAQWMTARW